MPVPGTNVTSARVSSEVGGVPARPSPAESAIEKHEECAAAISSSGLVRRRGSSAREGHETSKVPMPEDSMVTWPAPSMRVPSQWVRAVRVVVMRSLLVAADRGLSPDAVCPAPGGPHQSTAGIGRMDP